MYTSFGTQWMYVNAHGMFVTSEGYYPGWVQSKVYPLDAESSYSSSPSFSNSYSQHLGNWYTFILLSLSCIHNVRIHAYVEGGFIMLILHPRNISINILHTINSAAHKKNCFHMRTHECIMRILRCYYIGINCVAVCCIC